MGTNILEMVHEIAATISETEVEKQKIAGKEGIYNDYDIATPDTLDSSRAVFVRLTKNNSGGALLPGIVCKPDTASSLLFKTSTLGAAGTADKPIGVVNRHVAAAGVPDDEYFWMVVEGPTEVIDSGSGVTVGDTLATGAAGEVTTNSSTPTEFDIGVATETAAADAVFVASINCRGNS
jgi:hypothetical protein